MFHIAETIFRARPPASALAALRVSCSLSMNAALARRIYAQAYRAAGQTLVVVVPHDGVELFHSLLDFQQEAPLTQVHARVNGAEFSVAGSRVCVREMLDGAVTADDATSLYVCGAEQYEISPIAYTGYDDAWAIGTVPLAGSLLDFATGSPLSVWIPALRIPGVTDGATTYADMSTAEMARAVEQHGLGVFLAQFLCQHADRLAYARRVREVLASASTTIPVMWKGEAI